MDFSLTDESMFEQYQPALDSETNLFMGIYFNENTGKIITLQKGTYMVENSVYNTGIDRFFEEYSITKIDSKNLSYEGNTYTLLEELE